MYRLPDNTEVMAGQQFTIGETTYPPNWLALAAPDDLASLGIAHIPDPVPPTPTPVVPTLAEVKATQLAAINEACESELSQITGAYPPSEIVSWDSQYAEAAAWTANNSAPTPLLNAIIAENGQTLAVQAASVLSKAAAFKGLSGSAIGRRQLLTDQINAAATPEAALAIVW